MRVPYLKIANRAACCFAILAVAVLPAAAGPPAPSPRVPASVVASPPPLSSVHQDSGPNNGAAEDAVRRLLEDQAAAWNRGDLDGFLAGYWNSEKTAFAGSQGILHGWKVLRERYRKNYPDRKAMGTLTFSALEVTPLCARAALVLGKWHLDREAGAVGGVFSLVLRQFPEGWKIIADHTSLVLLDLHEAAH